MDLFEGFSWVGLLQIIGIDIILSGDNALVIALACRSLPPQQRKLGIWLGTGAAIVLRIAFAAAIVYLLMVPLLKLAGSMLLLWIAVKLLIPEEPGSGGHHATQDDANRASLWNAVKTVVIADAVMSFDNVISVAAAAKGSVGLLALGIAIAIPLMVIGAQMMLWLLDRFPWLMVAGSGLLGWIAGELAISDPIVEDALGHPGAAVHYGVAAACALFVILVGLWLAKRQAGTQRVTSSPEL
jgi:YjbE family integral membrane protein